LINGKQIKELENELQEEDWEDEQQEEEDSFSYFAILALMDNISIILGVLKIDKGNVFFARGDLVYAECLLRNWKDNFISNKIIK
jgi:hypothetical protein